MIFFIPPIRDPKAWIIGLPVGLAVGIGIVIAAFWWAYNC